MNPLYVGIDVSGKNNVACLMKPDGSKQSTFSVKNNPGGAKMMSEKIMLALTTPSLSDVVIGMEATSCALYVRLGLWGGLTAYTMSSIFHIKGNYTHTKHLFVQYLRNNINTDKYICKRYCIK